MKSGNGTAAPQWVYVGVHIVLLLWIIPVPNIFLVKIGIGGSWMGRLKGVSKTLPGFVMPIFIVWIPFAWHVEQWLHTQLKFINIPYFGSGKTEWFISLGILFAIPVLIACFAFTCGSGLYLLLYVFGWKIDIAEALKWAYDHPVSTLYFVVALKIAVISLQIILKWKSKN